MAAFPRSEEIIAVLRRRVNSFAVADIKSGASFDLVGHATLNVILNI